MIQTVATRSVYPVQLASSDHRSFCPRPRSPLLRPKHEKRRVQDVLSPSYPAWPDHVSPCYRLTLSLRSDPPARGWTFAEPTEISGVCQKAESPIHILPPVDSLPRALPSSEFSVSHSHMPINHLLSSLENREPRSGEIRPQWLVELIDRTAELFEPHAGVSRVGYDCWPTEEDWTVCLFLGDTEIIGGCEDGRIDPLGFCFDLRRLLELFEDVERIRWSVFPGAVADKFGDRSYISVLGSVSGHPVCVRLLSVAPDSAGPALRLFPNGDCRPVNRSSDRRH